MRIIDADKLINQIEQHCIDDEVTCKDDVIEIIDNAPTVVPEDFMNPYEEGYERARKDFERPTGEWKLDDTEQFCYCSNCEDTYYPRPLDPCWYYCPHCGAYMKGAEG